MFSWSAPGQHIGSTSTAGAVLPPDQTVPASITSHFTGVESTATVATPTFELPALDFQ